MYNNYEWYGRILEVREDRYAGLSGPGGRGGPRGGLRGGFRGFRGGGMRGSHRGSVSGEGRSFGSDIYADYSGPSESGMGGVNGSGGFQGAATAPKSSRVPYSVGEPNQQIMVRNVGRVFRCHISYTADITS